MLYLPLILLLMIALILAVSNKAVLAQSGEYDCGTRFSEAGINYIEAHTSGIYRNYTQRASASGGTIEIPIQINIVCPGSSSSSCFPDTDINNALAVLNTYFANVPMHFYECSDRNYIYNTDGVVYDDALSEANLCSAYDISKVVNIYFVDRIFSPTSNVLGYTSSSPETGADRIFVARREASNEILLYPNLVLSHEMAHFFGVYHTHGNGNPGTTTELVGGSNCDTHGDRVCDTPADPADIGFFITHISSDPPYCEYPSTLVPYCCDANSDNYAPLSDNIMFFKYCVYGTFDAFTDGQYSRIFNGYYGFRSYLTDESDLVMRDNWYDVGQEPNYLSSSIYGWSDIWLSPDLWNCIDDPDCTENEDPEYKASGGDNYLRVRITNRGCNPAPAGRKLNLYWTRARTGEIWMTHWMDITINQTSAGNPLGHIITSSPTDPLQSVPIDLPALDPGEELIITHPWQAPNPEWYAEDEGFWIDALPMICFLARITGEVSGFPLSIDGELTNWAIGTNVRRSNNIVTRNCVLTDIDPLNQTGTPKSIIIENIEDQPELLDIHLTDITRNAPDPFSNYFNIYLLLDEQLWYNWQANGAQSVGVTYTEEDRTLRVTDPSEAALKNVPFEARERRQIAVRFELEPPSGKKPETGLPAQTQRYSFYLWHSTNLPVEDEILKGGGIFEVAVHPQPISAIALGVIPVSCHPNPIQSNTTVQVQFSLREAAPVDIAIFDIGGRQVGNVVQNRVYAKGTHLLPIDMQTLPLASGVYFCRISTPHGQGVCKMVVMR